MGLPLFVIPVEAGPTSKSSDDTASRARSTIRRQRTIRRTSQRVRPEERTSYPEGYFNPVEVREREPTAATRARVADRIAERRRLLSGVDWAVTEGPRGEGGRVEVVDEPIQGPVSPPIVSSDPPRMPPVPESGDFQSNRDRLMRGRYARRGWAGGPPLEERASTAERSAYVERMAPTHLSPLPSLTPNFSPARRYTLEDPWTREAEISSTVFAEPNSTEDNWRSTTDTASSRVRPLRDLPSISSREVQMDSSRRDLPYLRRMGRRSIADFESRQRRLRQARLDGLGDRDRSLSPEGDAAWETLLTTLTPDPQPPSLGSSFASTSAAVSASSNTDSMTTSRTTPDSTDAMHPALDTACDVADDGSDDISDTEDEDSDAWEAYVELRGRRDELRSQRDGLYRSYAEAVEARARGGMEDNLGGMQRIVRRLASRDDIPDEWWAEVGLSRIIPREEAIGMRS